ncbi:type II toxin-antitoxin system VapC family toxin [Thiohalobacter sp. IOR34]|uniref:type II toxin-antitoxin system VapC family toxin n=1 Tax=Thiohalobacter sp. IOR34 TaxID=3057176 RepID=UPI0025B13ABA|nr:type II toxin-antitoxin system VapC family toxin [Thiohalobacter sp. IOR34]WJW75576.1 type II toxin-antitoxin system VapC family toxin [Thiohalobacter sp. IOR34]
MILVDTSVWIDHFRTGDPGLAALLEDCRVLAHPFVIGELACGNLARRSDILGLLQDLPQATVATDAEVRVFIERHRLMGRGIGYVDAHLLSSAALTESARLRTRDKRLAELAAELGLANAPSS